MQAHPVPQNITGFEFKLIGFLTLRQFGYLAGAGIVGLFFFLLPLYSIIKLAVILPVAAFGLALAFLPINDIPFDRWLVAFIRSVYSPTKRVWRKEPVEIGFLAPDFSIYLQRESVPVKKAVSDPSKLQNYLSSHRKVQGRSMLDVEEEKKLGQLSKQAADFSFSRSVPEKPSDEKVNQVVGQALPSLGVRNG